MSARMQCLDPALVALMRNPTVEGAMGFYEPFRRRMGWRTRSTRRPRSQRSPSFTRPASLGAAARSRWSAPAKHGSSSTACRRTSAAKRILRCNDDFISLPHSGRARSGEASRRQRSATSCGPVRRSLGRKTRGPSRSDRCEKAQAEAPGGSKSDRFNVGIANAVLAASWITNKADQERLVMDVGHALAGIAPTAELEGMLAAQMVAAHQASMECFRGAMLHEQTFEGRTTNLA